MLEVFEIDSQAKSSRTRQKKGVFSLPVEEYPVNLTAITDPIFGGSFKTCCTHDTIQYCPVALEDLRIQ